jgi:hypothetical protein
MARRSIKLKNIMKDDYFVEAVPCVHVGDGEWIATDKVEFVDISEDFQGYDLMTFIYEGKEMQSRITSRPV